MARTVDQIMRDTIGGLVLDSAFKQSQIETLAEENLKLKEQADADKQTEPSKPSDARSEA